MVMGVVSSGAGTLKSRIRVMNQRVGYAESFSTFKITHTRDESLLESMTSQRVL